MAYERLEGNINDLRKENGRDQINKITGSLNDKKPNANLKYQATQSHSKYEQTNGKELCNYCGYKKHQDKLSCPAKGAECKKCGKANHFAKVCRSSSTAAHEEVFSKPFTRRKTTNNFNTRNNKTVASIDEEKHVTLSKAEYAEFIRYKKAADYYDNGILSISNSILENKANRPRVKLKLHDQIVSFLIDTGSPINVIDEWNFNNLNPRPHLNKCNTKYYGFKASEALPILGQFTTNVQSKNRSVAAAFIVIEGEAEALMSYPTSMSLGIININCDQDINTINKASDNGLFEKPLNIEQLATLFPKLFSDKIGCIKNAKIKLEIDESVKPVKQQQRPVPFHLRDAVERELLKQVEQDIIERVDTKSGPTPWVTNLVIVPKDKSTRNNAGPTPNLNNNDSENTEIRLTCDSRMQNRAIKRTRFPTKTIDDIVYMVNGARIFSKIDIRKAFHQLELAEESRN
jgi:hypothetical protein